MRSALELFLPPVQRWFTEALGAPTAPQAQGWPAIAAGQHTLILAPTGSGKTLAAFLACLDHLWRQPRLEPGVRVLYISPLKALNNDIYRNLQLPLAGVAEAARQLAFPLPTIESGLRTGDTSTAERQRLLRKPPHVLITTPESLHLLLTSRGRDSLRGVTHCIVDEIHALCGNKRGVFLALLLERLAALTGGEFVRIGLSATQRPLEEVARYLGGARWHGDALEPRPVTIVDAGLRKALDVLVVSPVEQFGAQPEKTIWPAIYSLLHELVLAHTSTIIFANNRRSVERITAQLNALVPAVEGDTPAQLVRAHHGSVALEVRHATELALKEGKLPAVVATASLEMGIDMGAVDLVCQIESPGNVSRALQRVGRAGHLETRTSKGRLIPKTLADLLEQAVLARAMTEGAVEELHVPRNCLDVLAQQIVAMTAVETWAVPELYRLLRQAYPYRELTPQALDAVLEMVSGRYRFQLEEGKRSAQSLQALQPRISWDRVHNRLLALPGSKQLALLHGGTIPDTGQYLAYTVDGVRIGELDEEFVYERRLGEAFLLGTNTWRIDKIDTDRVLVVPAEGAPAIVPFWRGEQPGRSYDLGAALGKFLRQCCTQLEEGAFLSWLRSEYHLDAAAARNLAYYVRRQLDRVGCVPTDQTIVVEASRDPLGDWQVIVLSPFGHRLHYTLRLLLENRLRARLGYTPQCLHDDDGLLIRLTDSAEPVLDLFADLHLEQLQAILITELSDSALFALRFRQNAARALLMPRAAAGKRAPLWLQRLRGKDLLQVARRHPDFPIVVETYRECFADHLDVPHLQELLAGITSGSLQVVTRRLDTPSPFAAELLFRFQAAYMYQYDAAETATPATPQVDVGLLEQLLPTAQEQLDPRAVTLVQQRLRGGRLPPRTAPEMAELLRRVGDFREAEAVSPLRELLEELQRDGVVCQFALPGGLLWILQEERLLYQQAFGATGSNVAASLLTCQMEQVDKLVPTPSNVAASLSTCRMEQVDKLVPTMDEQQRAAEHIVQRYFATHVLVSLPDLLERYPCDPEWLRVRLEAWAQGGRIVRVEATGEHPTVQWSLPDHVEQVQHTTLVINRREVQPVAAARFADFLLRWQRLHPETRGQDVTDLQEVLQRLQGVRQPAPLWERVLLPSRFHSYQSRWLDECLESGDWLWVGSAAEEADLAVAFVLRAELAQLPPLTERNEPLQGAEEVVHAALQQRGALFVTDLSQAVKLPPSTVRAALWSLVRRGLVTNDRYDAVRHGEHVAPPESATALRRMRARQLLTPRPEGRWALLPWQPVESEVQALHVARLLLQRHGIVAREVALRERWLPPWRVLYEVLSRLELAGEVRRGYFVEGLSGAQFALPEASRLLAEPVPPTAPAVLVHSQDPANVYGSGGLFDLPNTTFQRRPGNWLVLCGGEPVLIVEQHGKQLTSSPRAAAPALAAAVGELPRLLQLDRELSQRHKLTVSLWNGQPIRGSAGEPLLEQVGFVADYQDLTLYGGWK